MSNLRSTDRNQRRESRMAAGKSASSKLKDIGEERPSPRIKRPEASVEESLSGPQGPMILGGRVFFEETKVLRVQFIDVLTLPTVPADQQRMAIASDSVVLKLEGSDLRMEVNGRTFLIPRSNCIVEVESWVRAEQ
jgi:hypothetical protein